MAGDATSPSRPEALPVATKDNTTSDKIDDAKLNSAIANPASETDKMSLDQDSAPVESVTKTHEDTAMGATSAPEGGKNSKAVVDEPSKDSAAVSDEEKGNDTEKSTETLPAMDGSADSAQKLKAKKGGATPKMSKRKSFANLKAKDTPKKVVPEINYEPGMYVLAKMRRYPPWPAIILNDDLLPEFLQKSRPNARIGKAKDASIPPPNPPRHWPVMYLGGTFEYSWMSVNNLDPLTPEILASPPSNIKGKGLQEAYSIAQGGFTLADVRDKQSQEPVVAGAVEDEDEEDADDTVEADEMDIDEPETGGEGNSKKPSGKKRKKSDSVSEGEDDEVSEKPAKTPKKAVTAKGKKTPAKSATKVSKTPKTPRTPKAPANGTGAAKSTTKPKASTEKKEQKVSVTSTKKSPAPRRKSKAKSTEDVVDSDTEEEASKPKKGKKEVDPKVQRETEVMFLRHRLQKGFLSKGKDPVEKEMPDMAKYFDMLESLGQIEEDIMKKTKINKVLKAIMKLTLVPCDEEYHFRKRSTDLLEKWNELIGPGDKNQAPTSTPPSAKKEKKSQNGVKPENTTMKDAGENALEKEEPATKAGEAVTTGEAEVSAA